MASKRRFEFVEGSSSKFWEVEVEGPRMTVCFGRVGTAGSLKDKTFASAEESKREAAKLIAEALPGRSSFTITRLARTESLPPSMSSSSC